MTENVLCTHGLVQGPLSTKGKLVLMEDSADYSAVGKEPALPKDPVSILEPSEGKSGVVS